MYGNCIRNDELYIVIVIFFHFSMNVCFKSLHTLMWTLNQIFCHTAFSKIAGTLTLHDGLCSLVSLLEF